MFQKNGQKRRTTQVISKVKYKLGMKLREKLLIEIDKQLKSTKLPGQCYPNVPDDLVMDLVEKYLTLKMKYNKLKRNL